MENPAVFVCNGASGHSRTGERAKDDFYASHPKSAQLLMTIEPQITDIWECAVGMGHLAEEFRKEGKLGAVSDIMDRGYHPDSIPTKYNLDFMKFNKVWRGDIVTNPPFAEKEWAIHSIELIKEGHYLALFQKIQFLEGKGRRIFFEKYPPIRVWVSSSRIPCAKNGDVKQFEKSSAACYCWYIWKKGYIGPTELKWFN